MKEEKNPSRRKFILKSATIALAQPLLFNLPGFAKSKRKKLKHACIGVGGMGGHDLSRFNAHPDVEIVAICDIDEAPDVNCP